MILVNKLDESTYYTLPQFMVALLEYEAMLEFEAAERGDAVKGVRIDTPTHCFFSTSDTHGFTFTCSSTVRGVMVCTASYGRGLT